MGKSRSWKPLSGLPADRRCQTATATPRRRPTRDEPPSRKTVVERTEQNVGGEVAEVVPNAAIEIVEPVLVWTRLTDRTMFAIFDHASVCTKEWWAYILRVCATVFTFITFGRSCYDGPSARQNQYITISIRSEEAGLLSYADFGAPKSYANGCLLESVCTVLDHSLALIRGGCTAIALWSEYAG